MEHLADFFDQNSILVLALARLAFYTMRNGHYAILATPHTTKILTSHQLALQWLQSVSLCILREYRCSFFQDVTLLVQNLCLALQATHFCFELLDIAQLPIHLVNKDRAMIDLNRLR